MPNATTPHSKRRETDREGDEIFIELHPGRPAYVRLRVGDYLQEGDASHREQFQTTSPSLATWEIVEITPERVVGRHVDSDETSTWARADIERALAIGTYSTNLTDFERISVHLIGRRDEDGSTAENHRPALTNEAFVSVVAYGDSGLKYGRRYRFLEAGSKTLELWDWDEPEGGFPDEVEVRLDEVVRSALLADGFTLDG